MKKFLKGILATTLVLSMTAALAGCGGGEEAAPAEGEEAAEGENMLVMATSVDFPPYEFYEGQEATGIDVEIANALAEKLGYDGVKVEDMAFDSIIPSITAGKADIAMAGMTVTDERKESVDFSASYATGIQAIIVAEDSDIATVDDLLAEGANHTVGVQTATTGDIYTTGDIEEAGLGTVERYTKGADAVAALLAGKIDCVVIDNEPAKSFVEQNEGLKILDTEYVTEDYAIALQKGSELTAKIDEALQALKDDGTIQAIIDKYIKAE